MRPIITLLTDFGTQDGYVGAMKGVILGDAPEAAIVDLTHDIPPQDVLAGAFALAQAAPYFPVGTVHVAVVDPGVGTERRALVAEHAGHVYIGPDNGLFTFVLGEGPGGTAGAASRVRVIDRLPSEWSLHPTFHGRDLFARVAARLAAGDAPTRFAGAEVEPRRLELPRPSETPEGLDGVVIHCDRFGNLVTNLATRLIPERLGAGLRCGGVEVAGALATLGTTYGDVAPGELVAYGGSAGYLEIGVRDGSAAARLGARRGTPVRVRRPR
ncbi:MAG TPA: SAM-dependent chlorinase/fluorinase [Polyangia bacterium]|nr:SAM-dependent chlorinase/fluorinase [Polyangia bacterium]